MTPARWDNSNTRNQPVAFIDAVVREQRAAVAQHGLDPCTQAQAAAHEAGHVIVGYAIGEDILGARLMREGGRWVGANRRDHASYSQGMVPVGSDPARALRSGINSMAGFSGEIVAGLAHPSSSIDERMLAREYAAAVADASGGSEQAALDGFARLCIGALMAHRQAFDTIRGHLCRTRRLTAAEALRMLRHVRRIELPTDPPRSLPLAA